MIQPADAVQLLQGALIVVFGLAVLLWRIPDTTCVCESCPKHTNDRRMERLRQAELSHDYAHKGGGFREGAKDVYSCRDETCPRNPKHD